ncbi:MAG: riboflavin synthase [Phycisphaerae bacterium]
MFTGLIEHMGIVAGVERIPAGVRLEIDPAGWTYRPQAGASVAVNGCCLTVAADPSTTSGRFAFNVVPQTLAMTTLGGLQPGSKVNLEASATPQTLLGGHVVQGHIDGTGRVLQVVTAGEYRLRISADPHVMEFITPKGSIAVEGVSLTVAGVNVEPGGGGWFDIALIPTTLEKTTLGSLVAGDRVNLETDVLGRTVVHWLKNFASGRIGGPES